MRNLLGSFRREPSTDPSFVQMLLLALVALLVVGFGLYRLAPAPAINAAEIAKMLAHAGFFAPEPAERLAYVGLTIAAPVIVALAIWIGRRIRPLPISDTWLGIALIIAALVASTPRDEFQRPLVSSILLVPFWVSAVVLGASLLALRRRWTIRAQRIATLALCGFATVISLAWRIQGADTLSDASGHFDAFFYSVVQIGYGGTCLVDVLPQYGCYGEFLAPLFRLVGLSVLADSIIMAIMVAFSLCATILFARSLIRNPVVLTAVALWIVIVQNRVLWTWIPPDEYFQYWPLRTILPALSFLAVLWWQRGGSSLKAFTIGAVAGLGIWWNLDTGAVVLIALFGFLLLNGASGSNFTKRRVAANIAACAWFVGGALAAMLAFYGWLCLKSGQVVDVAQYVVFQDLFVGLGFAMMPMPRFPAAWAAAIALLVVVFLQFGLRIGRGPFSLRTERAVYLAVLAIGLFSYFVGRSHPVVFIHVTWPFILLAGYLVDAHGVSGGARTGRPVRALLAALVTGALVAGVADLWAGMPSVAELASTHLQAELGHDDAGDMARKLRFVRETVTPGAPSVAVLATNQGALLIAAGRKSALPGTGLQETIRKQDAERQIDALVGAGGPRDLFVGRELLAGDRQTWGSSPWVKNALPRIEQVYDRDQSNTDKELIHFTRMTEASRGADK
ncbi:hypothetical protein [Bradyrhizobium sp.]|uniref:hypothetical protein n=1 Tax=Bradyrhizobium sp. TaxID=376 RepID=UPI0039E273D1